MKFLKHLTVIFIALLVFSCNTSDDSGANGTAKLSVKLVDEPGDFENVFVEVVDVMVKYENENSEETDEETGWESIGIINPGVYDLLELTGGVTLNLVENENIQVGTLKQIRLILGDDNSVVLEGETEARPLNTPSAQQSGLKVVVDETINEGFNYDFILDFNVHESIVMAGNSENINLNPVLRASLEVSSGNISGTVLPAEVASEVVATNGIVTVSAFTNDLGNFQLFGLLEGIYTLTVIPDSESGLNTTVIENVEVQIGQITELETIILE